MIGNILDIAFIMCAVWWIIAFRMYKKALVSIEDTFDSSLKDQEAALNACNNFSSRLLVLLSMCEDVDTMSLAAKIPFDDINSDDLPLSLSPYYTDTEIMILSEAIDFTDKRVSQYITL